MTWFRYRRRRWLAGFAAALLLVVGGLVVGGGELEVVIYNKSNRPLGPVRVAAGGVAVEFPALGVGESAVRALPIRAGEEIALWLAEDPPRQVTGPWVQPGETAQVVVRVDEFGDVLFSQLPTWRSRFLAALR